MMHNQSVTLKNYRGETREKSSFDRLRMISR
jgi:hypothetical protein